MPKGLIEQQFPNQINKVQSRFPQKILLENKNKILVEILFQKITLFAMRSGGQKPYAYLFGGRRRKSVGKRRHYYSIVTANCIRTYEVT